MNKPSSGSRCDEEQTSQPKLEGVLAAETDGSSCVAVGDDEAGRCEVEWERPKGLCRPHRCDLLKGHKGKHICDCGWARRLLQRDEPERFETA